MYGTIVKLTVKHGQAKALQDTMYPDRESMPGYVASYMYQTDADPNVMWVAVLFDSKEAYVANAHRPETNAQYEQMLQYLTVEPEWHDGEVVYVNQGEAAPPTPL